VFPVLFLRVSLLAYFPCSLITEQPLSQVLHELMLELRVVKALDHPSICQFLGAAASFPGSQESQRDWRIGLVFELCSQGDLRKLLDQKRVFLLSQKLMMAADIAKGIAYLQSQNIVHRDLSSRNLLITADGHVKICDFGCARIMTQYSYKPSFVSGSPPWMAPEQIFGQPITLAVDIFAFGAILWELLTGQMPFARRMGTVGLDGLQRMCRNESPLPPPSDAVLGNLDAESRGSIRRLIVHAHHTNPALRPCAEQVRQIAESIYKRYDRTGQRDSGKGHVQVVRDIEYRAELGENPPNKSLSTN